MLSLRPYQETAVHNIEVELEHNDSTLLVMATGTGKTRAFTHLAQKRFQRNRKPILVLAHRSELLEQARDSFMDAGIHSAIEKADSYARSQPHDAVIASVQSLCRPDRLAMYPRDYFDFIITDEAHHSTASTYRRIYDHFVGTKHLGVTATPNRHDEIGLRNIYQSCAFQYTIQDGIREKFLCNIVGKQIQVQDIHLESIKIVAGEFSQPELDAMLREEKVLQSMVRPTMEYAGSRPTIVFTSGVEHAHDIAACFNRIRHDCAVAIDGKTPDELRNRHIQAFKSGKVQFIINVGVLTEGFDHPPTACIALFRPTRSLGLLAQMIGRGSRIAEEKSDCLVLDFVGVDNTVRTMTVMDVLDGTILNDQEHKKAQELQEAGKSAMDALADAKDFVAQLDAIQAKMRALSTSTAFDVLQMFAVPNCKGLYGGDRATEKQTAYLEGKGVKCAGLQKGEASKLIEKFIKRQEKGLATFKQLRYLKKLGHKDNFIDALTFAEASRLIGEKAPARSFAHA